MVDIGYDEAYIHHVRTDNLDSLRRLLDAPNSDEKEEPSASHAQIERELMDDEDTLMANADDPHSSLKRASKSRTTSKSPTKGLPGTSGKQSSHNPSPVKKSTVKGQVVTSPGKMRSDYADEIRREVMEGFNQHLDQSTSDVSPSKGGPPLRSPWDPISRKKVAPIVTNDTPPQKVPPKTSTKQSRGGKSRAEERHTRENGFDDQEEQEQERKGRYSIDLETKEQAIARYKRSKGKVMDHEVESSPSPSKKRPRDEPPSLSPSPDEIKIGGPPTRSLSRHSSTNDDDAEVEVERTVEKRAKRDIRTQESDEEFPVESIGNLMTRRAKVVGIRQGDKGKPSAKDDDVNLYQSSTARRQQQDESEGDDWSDQEKPVSAKANKVMKRLRDSISGKEDSKSPPKKKGLESTAMDDEKPPTKSRTQHKKSIRGQEPVKSDSDPDEGAEQHESKPSRKGTKRTKPVAQPADHSMSSTSSDSDQEEHVSNPKKIPRSKSMSVLAVDHQSEGPSHRARRGAATKATQLLRDKIMPDANNFADEFRRGKIRGDWEDSKKRKRDENDDDDRSKRRRSVMDSDAKASTRFVRSYLHS